MFEKRGHLMKGRTAACALLAAALVPVGLAATAQELVYKPINPSFGGDSFNSSHLLGIANAQNDYDDPDADNGLDSQSEQFIRQLQSRLLSSLAGEVNEAIFGDNPQDSGTITFGDQVIEFVRGIDSVQLTITDLSTGTITEIEIPLLNVAGASSSSGLTDYSTALTSSSQGALPASPDASGDLTGTSLYGGLDSGSLNPGGEIY